MSIDTKNPPGSKSREKIRLAVTKTTLTEQTYEVVKERILDRALTPGQRLSIDALARDIGVSSSPLREALARLEGERLVVSTLYSGYSVAPEPSLTYLNDLLDFRIMIEGNCALIGAPLKDPSILNAMKETISEMASIKRLGTHYKQYRKFVAADSRFHQLIVESARNIVATDAYRDMNAILLQARLYLNRTSGEKRAVEVGEEHLRILRAFERGDGIAALEGVRTHLEGGKRRLLSVIPDTSEQL